MQWIIPWIKVKLIEAFAHVIAARWVQLGPINVILLDKVLRVDHWLLDGGWLCHKWRWDVGNLLRLLLLLIHDFQAISANPNSLIVSIFWYFHKILRTVVTNCSPTFPAMMLPLKKAKYRLTDKTIWHLLTTPERSLSNFKGLNPIFETSYFWIRICESFETYFCNNSLWDTYCYCL